MSNIDPMQLAQDAIYRFLKSSAYTNFENLVEAKTGLNAFESARIKFTATKYSEDTQALANRLADVFESVYGKRPEVFIYTRV